MCPFEHYRKIWTLSSPLPGRNQYVGFYGGDNKKAPRVGSEPTNSPSLGRRLIHYTLSSHYTPRRYTLVITLSKSGHDTSQGVVITPPRY
ncbi:hypothetical protein DPMN_013479 [Dreissena polymorpha]|uniref:Uncharacterized protein n=1 Tax=Dreissena polymorpha TaxID=45954 RepID=A0A9D4S3Q3_DREPO|nr:hypothetical protein DPMN_013479 [Dreissena polymorpha]